MDDVPLKIVGGAVSGILCGIPFSIGLLWLAFHIPLHTPKPPARDGVIVMQPSARQGWELHVYSDEHTSAPEPAPDAWTDWEISKPE